MPRFIPVVVLCITAALSFRAQSATYSVTSPDCSGTGSLAEAISQANASPGQDRIELPEGFTVNLRSACPTVGGAGEDSLYEITDSLEIVGLGKGASLQGRTNWVNSNGVVTSFTFCPAEVSSILLFDRTPGLFRIGVKGQDNSAVKVTLSNLTVDQVAEVARVFQNASLAIENSTISNVYDPDICGRGAFNIDGNFSSKNVLFRDIVNWDSKPLEVVSTPVILGINGDLSIEDSAFTRIRPFGPILWEGSPGSRARIVNTIMEGEVGLTFLGDITTEIVNSVIDAGYQGTTESRIYNGSTGDLTFKATTALLPSLGFFNESITPFFYQRNPNSSMRFSQSAIGISFPRDGTVQQPLLASASSAGLIADEYTWMQPSTIQEAATLRALTNQPSLLTDAPGLPLYTDYPTGEPTLEQTATPLAGSASSPGLLVDAIPSAACGSANALINPIDGSCITRDIFNNPRVDGNGTRNIGAVQLQLAPRLSISGTNDGAVILRWTRPKDVANVTGYQVKRRLNGGGAFVVDKTVSGVDALATTVSGLTNGSTYDFQIEALVNTTPSGVPSNTVTGTPYGVVGTPVVTATPGDGQVQLSWPPVNLGGLPLHGYVVTAKVSGSRFNIASANILTTSTTVIETGLSNGVTYDFEVTAYAKAPDGTLIRGLEGTASGTPTAPPVLTYPSNVTTGVGSSTSIQPKTVGLIATPQYSLVSGTLPTGLSLDPNTGEITGAPTTAGTVIITVAVSQPGLPSSLSAQSTFSLEVLISTSDLRLAYPDINVPAGTAVSVRPTLTASSGGSVFSLESGTLPAGLSLDSSSGVISGTPSVATDGFVPLTLRVTEGSNVAQAPVIVQVQPTLAYAPLTEEVGNPVNLVPTVSPGVGMSEFSLDPGSVLPKGLTLDPGSGVISGTPLSAGVVLPLIQLKMVGAQTQTTVATVRASISAYAIDSKYPDTSYRPKETISVLPTTTGAKGSVTYSVATSGASALPQGLSLNATTGEITGSLSGTDALTTYAVKVSDGYTSTTVPVSFTKRANDPVPVPLLLINQLLALIAMISLMLGWQTRRAVARSR